MELQSQIKKGPLLMELQEKVDNLDKRLKKQSRLLRLTTALLLVTIGFLITRYLLGVEGRLDLQGRRVYVHKGGQPLISTSIHPYGLNALNLYDAMEPYGTHATLDVRPYKTQLWMRENSANGVTDLQLFVTRDRSGISIRDHNQKERVSLLVTEDGPKLLLLDENGQVLFEAP